MSSTITIPAPGATPFDSIKEVDADGAEIWRARKLQALMAYAQWKNLKPAIERAMASARNQGVDTDDAFREANEVSGSRNLGQRRQDFKLTRFAAYLVAMNGDPNKPEVAAAQAYFAVRTREAEVAEQKPTGDDLDVLQGMIDRLREDRQRIVAVEGRQDVTEAKVAAIEGKHDWFTALGYAKLNGRPTNRPHLQRVGAVAGRILRSRGEEPVKRQDATFGSVNTYPADVLAQAFEEVVR
ncbi:hypothetical protein [Nocardiopsis suaedae]|uniref:DNA damage-inducible protein D n=1 Tax=Nocardiopsis suaedae TaxID=3018444 RepID=A0ABT4TM16_9ACTN|nr:hypothetical protein [Nocardiopsis suaedae]MDA2805732.1 hypothetical protein [Nocardiopsis suaedae]